MNQLQQLLQQARTAASNVAQPAYRRGAAVDARAFEQRVDIASLADNHSVSGLLALMKALPDVSDPSAIREHGNAIYSVASAIQRMQPKPAPRRHWVEGDRA